MVEVKVQEYKAARSELRAEIRRAKKRAWRETVDEIDSDPWGKPYKIIMGKLGGKGKNFNEVTKAKDLELIIDDLFPVDKELVKVKSEIGERRDEWSVRSEEVERILRERRGRTERNRMV